MAFWLLPDPPWSERFTQEYFLCKWSYISVPVKGYTSKLITFQTIQPRLNKNKLVLTLYAYMELSNIL